ncbi:MAG: DUF308 domain-containing protein [Thermomicrobiales bacterium]|nr:DUF308 domain-containing protein [Thermomicrobiales bacterium]
MAMASPMQESLTTIAKEVLDLWWLWVVKGILAVAFGVAAWVWPGLTITTLIWVLGAYIVADGVLDVVGMFAFGDLSWGRRVLLGLWGLAQIVGGIVIWFAPGLGAVTLMVIIGVWALSVGIFLVVSAFTSDGHLMKPWLQALLGILGAVSGIYLVVNPGAGILGSIWILGLLAIVWGVGQIVSGFQLRSLRGALG